jgi:hypothetical protein
MGAVSLIVPAGTTNLIDNSSVEFGITGWVASGSTIQRSTAWQMFGVSSLEVVTNNAAANEGAYYSHNPGGAGTFTATVFVSGSSGTVRIRLRDQTNGTENSSAAETLTSAGQRLEVTHTAGAGCADLRLYVETDAQQSITFYADAAQLEELAFATTYCDGDQDGCEWLGARHASDSRRSAQSRAGGRIYNLSTDFNVSIDTLTGAGMPPIRHNVQEMSQQPGAILQNTKVRPRVLQLRGHTETANKTEKYQARKDLIDALKEDLVATLQPVIVQFDDTGVDLWAFCYYDTGLEGNFECVNYDEFTLRLIAYDPGWYEIGESAEPILVSESATFRYVAGKMRSIDEWYDLDLTSNPTVNGTVYAITRHPDGSYYVGGDFQGMNGVAGRDYIARYIPTTDTWETVGAGSSVNSAVYSIVIASNGDVYIGGNFTNVGGAAGDYVAYWDGTNWNPVSGGGTGLVRALVFGDDGILYIGGTFLNWNAIANADYIVSWDGSAYAALGTGANNFVFTLAVGPDGKIYAGGTFSLMGGVANTRAIAYWDGSTWNAMDQGVQTTPAGSEVVEAVVVDKDGTVYVGGLFDSASGISITYNIAGFDGFSWFDLGGGVGGAPDPVYALVIAPDGTLYAGGAFLTAGGLSVDRIARWNGYTWATVDAIFPGVAPIVWSLAVGPVDPVIIKNYDIFAGFATTGSSVFGPKTTVSNGGSQTSFPRFEIYNSGFTNWARLRNAKNITTGLEMLFDLDIVGGETVTITLTPSNKTITSDLRQNIIRAPLPASDFAKWSLIPGSNDVSVFISGTPDETGDNNNQLSGWEYVNGVSSSNTDRGIVYVSIIDDGGGFYHVNLYKDSGRTQLVGHTASYNGTGDQSIVADNSSGLGGHITIDATTAADTDITVYYCICDLVWSEVHWGVSGSV